MNVSSLSCAGSSSTVTCSVILVCVSRRAAKARAALPLPAPPLALAAFAAGNASGGSPPTRGRCSVSPMLLPRSALDTTPGDALRMLPPIGVGDNGRDGDAARGSVALAIACLDDIATCDALTALALAGIFSRFRFTSVGCCSCQRSRVRPHDVVDCEYTRVHAVSSRTAANTPAYTPAWFQRNSALAAL